LVGCGTSPDILGDLPSVIERKLGDRLQGLFFNGQPERSNAIFGPSMIHLAGDAALHESIRGVDVYFPPGAFGQNHLPLFERAVDRIAELVSPGQTIAEYYCGVGSIGLTLLREAKALRFNERSPDGLRGLELGLAKRPEAERTRATILAGAAGDRLDGLTGADLVVVDPPRRGLDVALTSALAESPPKRLIYLSCGLESLVADLKLLERNGTLALRGLETFNFFPFTEHVETLVWLDRVGP
jgi:23S rRNA (uracil1939-C5)-methyltransferase